MIWYFLIAALTAVFPILVWHFKFRARTAAEHAQRQLNRLKHLHTTPCGVRVFAEKPLVPEFIRAIEAAYDLINPYK